MAELDLDAWRRVVEATHADPAAGQVRHDLAESAFGRRLLAQLPAILAALERAEQDMNNFGDQLAASMDMAHHWRQRAERVEKALRELREGHGHEMDEHGRPWHPSWCVACVVDAALAAAPGEERGGGD